MPTKVTMNLTDEELALVEQLRRDLQASTNTATVGQSLRIAALVARALRSGKQLAFLDHRGHPEARLLIPGLSVTF